jgi:hypothetical protein
MIEDKMDVIREAESDLEYAKCLVRNHSAMFDDCIKHIDTWMAKKKERLARLHISSHYAGVNMDLYMTEDDSLQDVNMFLDTLSYELVGTSENIEFAWIRYEFRHNDATLHVIVHYEKSKYCKIVETGETRPVLKRACI